MIPPGFFASVSLFSAESPAHLGERRIGGILAPAKETVVRMLWILVALSTATPALARNELETGFSGALRGCEEWVLKPESHSTGAAPFISAVGLGQMMALVPQIADDSQPSPELRSSNRYWRINSTPNAGYMLVVSDDLPMCHITGGGGVDLQPVVTEVLSSKEFTRRWSVIEETTRGDMLTTEYRNKEEPKFQMVVSRSRKPSDRLDRVQVIATALYDIGK